MLPVLRYNVTDVTNLEDTKSPTLITLLDKGRFVTYVLKVTKRFRSISSILCIVLVPVIHIAKMYRYTFLNFEKIPRVSFYEPSVPMKLRIKVSLASDFSSRDAINKNDGRHRGFFYLIDGVVSEANKTIIIASSRVGKKHQ